MDEAPAALELTFWRTLYRYLLSIVASLACGGAWTFIDLNFLHLGVLPTIITGVLALALGFFLMGFLWLSLDLSRPVPEGVDEHDRSRQLAMLWWGIPLTVVGVCGVVMVLAVVVAGTVLNANIPVSR